MSNYQSLYTILFNAITDAITDLENQNVGLALERLKQAQILTEEQYLETETNPTV